VSEPFIPYNRPGVGEEEALAAADAVRSGWLTTGPRVREFEAAFAALTGAPHAIAVNSCTAGLALALAAWEVGPGDEVVTSAYTFASAVNVIVHRGATPVLVDICEDALNPDPAHVARAVTPRTRVIMPVHFAGHPARMDEILALARAAGAFVLEDAAHASWARLGERMVGNIGDATAFSLYATKNLTTGEGGMVTVRDADLAERIRRLSLHGMTKNAWRRYDEGGRYGYDILEPGFKANLGDIQGAIGLVQLRRLPELQARRGAIAARFNTAFASEPALEPPVVRPGVRHAWHLYPLQLNLERLSIDRDTFIEALREHGIGTSVHFIPVHYHTFYRERFGWKRGDFPVAERTFEREVSLPLYPGLSDAEVDRIIEATLAVALAHRR
jgi:dTDP-4-amino-4,6-dideoxygalactose transaminase